MLKHFTLLAMVIIVASPLHAQNSDDLIISEYVEGSSNNKYLEIFNGTGQPVDLDDYEIQIYSNGNHEVGRQISLEGDLSPDDVYVIGHTSGEIYQESDMEHGWLSFNGNDAVVLFKKSTGTEIDVFGCIGQDPGEAWVADGDLRTKDMTLRRDPDVTEGAINEDNAEDFNTLATEWNATSEDDISGLGEHPGTATHKASSTRTLKFDFYPNPAIGHVFVETDKAIRNIQIFNLTGQKVSSPAEKSGHIDLSELKMGWYVLKVRFEDDTFHKLKFLKE